MVFDLHNDLLTSGNKAIAFDDNIVYAIWTTRLNNPLDFIKNLPKIKYTSIEDLHFITDDIFFVLKELKPLYASLTWNDENRLGGGAYSETGLTAYGKEIIKRLEESNIILDTAHLNRKSFFQAAYEAKRPFICSHTCFDGIVKHKRNLDDEQIKIIIACGGLIGLCFVPEFMGKQKANIKDVIIQIDYFTQKFGCNHLAIGTDFFGTDCPAIKNYKELNKLKKHLIKLGYKQNEIDKIFYKNAIDFIRRYNGEFR